MGLPPPGEQPKPARFGLVLGPSSHIGGQHLSSPAMGCTREIPAQIGTASRGILSAHARPAEHPDRAALCRHRGVHPGRRVGESRPHRLPQAGGRSITATDSTRSAPWGGGTERSQAPSRWILGASGHLPREAADRTIEHDASAVADARHHRGPVFAAVLTQRFVRVRRH